jgi:hypothetical protein
MKPETPVLEGWTVLVLTEGPVLFAKTNPAVLVNGRRPVGEIVAVLFFRRHKLPDDFAIPDTPVPEGWKPPVASGLVSLVIAFTKCAPLPLVKGRWIPEGEFVGVVRVEIVLVGTR